MRPSTIVLSALFGLFLFVVLIWLLNQHHAEVLEGQMRLMTLRHAGGVFLIAASGLLLLIRAVAGESSGRLLGLVLPALVGALLIEPSWGVSLGLAATTLGFALRPALGGSVRRMPPVAPPHLPPAL